MTQLPQGWSKEKRDSILHPGAAEVSFSKESFQVIADHQGVRFSGRSNPMREPQDFEDLAKIVGFAGVEFKKLASARIHKIEASGLRPVK
jgi:hypothetical protein